MELKDKTVVVTGGGSGFGLGIAAKTGATAFRADVTLQPMIQAIEPM